MRTEYVSLVEILRRVDFGIYDHEEFEKAMAWVEKFCKPNEGHDYNEDRALFPGTPSVKLNGKKPSELSFNQFDVMLGPGYQFSTGPFKTRVRCGGIYRVASKNFDYTNAIYYYRGGEYNNISERSETWRFNAQFGLYAGAGLEYPLRKCSLICDVDYIYDYNRWTALTGPDLMVSDSDETTIKQHGFCLSLGVKF